ncbi:MAG: 23S rRNA (pseudouridine(1915)-N(3))-methyltransferase RlmH, partial [Bacteroidales bacterium]|nr:23S rRNA (pseudouridine(1915)-N(3))-methyltransferase RlmH [Bacteroidales bacterium]
MSHILKFVEMKITLLLVGKTAFPYIMEGISLYEKRISFYVNYNRIDIPELKGVQALSKEQIKEK